MKEPKWNECTDPLRMLDFVRQDPTYLGHMHRTFGPWVGLAPRRPRRYASERKMRLFGCACCRLVWHLLAEPWLREAIETVERHADGLVPEADLPRVADEDFYKMLPGEPQSASYARHSVQSLLFWVDLASAKTMWVEDMVAESVRRAIVAEAGKRERRAIRARQADILRDLFGPLPFRPVESTLGEAGFPTDIRSMAQQMLDERAFDHLPVLADALEDHGGSHPELITHLREGRSHTLGCWAVDLILAKDR